MNRPPRKPIARPANCGMPATSPAENSQLLRKTEFIPLPCRFSCRRNEFRATRLPENLAPRLPPWLFAPSATIIVHGSRPAFQQIVRPPAIDRGLPDRTAQEIGHFCRPGKAAPNLPYALQHPIAGAAPEMAAGQLSRKFEHGLCHDESPRDRTGGMFCGPGSFLPVSARVFRSAPPSRATLP